MSGIGLARPERLQRPQWLNVLAERARSGTLLPMLGGRLCNDLVLGGHTEVMQAYSARGQYPLEGQTLAEMAQFKSLTDDTITDPLALKEDYVKFSKRRLYDLAEAGGTPSATLADVKSSLSRLSFSQVCDTLGYPSYGDKTQHPLLLLANLNLPIYLTTGYHELMELALKEAGKQARTEYCRWHKDIEGETVFDTDYEPTPQEPLVYHLHGVDRVPASLVLTQDDYLTFLVACSQNVGKPTDPVHVRVRQAVSASSLLLLGYELQEWDFRALFWGLIVQRTKELTSLVTVQLEPSDMQQQYLQKYMSMYKFFINWCSFQTTVLELSEAVQNDE